MLKIYFIRAILIVMALGVWGLLERALDNSQTIDEAIAAAIVAHEEDPTAHLGAGESLAAHKSDEIIDHPAQSLVIDKAPLSLYQEMQTTWQAEPWNINAGSALYRKDYIIGFFLNSQSAFEAYREVPWYETGSYPQKDLMFTFLLRIAGLSTSDGYAAFGMVREGENWDENFVGIAKIGTSAKFVIYRNSSLVHSHTLQTGGTLMEYYSIFFDSVNESIVLFENETEISRYDTADWHTFIELWFFTSGVRSTNTNLSLQLQNWRANYNLGT